MRKEFTLRGNFTPERTLRFNGPRGVHSAGYVYGAVSFYNHSMINSVDTYTPGPPEGMYIYDSGYTTRAYTGNITGSSWEYPAEIQSGDMFVSFLVDRRSVFPDITVEFTESDFGKIISVCNRGYDLTELTSTPGYSTYGDTSIAQDVVYRNVSNPALGVGEAGGVENSNAWQFSSLNVASGDDRVLFHLAANETGSGTNWTHLWPNDYSIVQSGDFTDQGLNHQWVVIKKRYTAASSEQVLISGSLEGVNVYGGAQFIAKPL